MLNNILSAIEEYLNSNNDFSNIQIAYLNEMSDYMKKRNLIEKDEDNDKTNSLMNELNCIAEELNINKEDNSKIDISANTQDDIKNENVKKTTIANITEEQRKENTNVLIISEREGKVYLPYFQSDIDSLLLDGKYKTKEEIVETLYTIPLSKYSNPTISRISEGFKLMREREKASFIESLKYAFSLAFERKLHPAIIAACRTMDDLEVYLGLLDDKLTSLFDSFEIKFEYRPMEVSKNEKCEFSKGV